MVSEGQRYASVVRHFRRTRGVRRCSDGAWLKLGTQGLEGVVYISRDRTRVLKKVIVSLEEDPISRFEAMELVNLAASALGVCPRVHGVHYELDARGVLFFCIESDYFDGVTLGELLSSSSGKVACRKVEPMVRALVRKMIRGGVWHGDLHADNVLVRTDLSEVTFVDFGNGCFCFGKEKNKVAADAGLEALCLRKLDLRKEEIRGA